MGITMILLLVYLVLFAFDVFALTLGLKQKKWILFAVISSIIVISIIVLGYLWIKLPDENIEKNVGYIPNGLSSEYEWNNEEENNKVENIIIKVNSEVLNVKLEQNSSTEALVEKLKQGDITIEAYDYGDFEKVGDLGFNLPTSDTQITTKPGDIMLYQGNQITLFYGRNSWSYTKIGEVTGEEKNKLKDILGSGNVTLVLSID